MQYRISTMTTVVAILTAMTGCSHAPLDKHFDEANRSNITMQTLNPEAGKEEALNTLDGQKSERLLQRYRTDSGKASSEGLVTKVAQ